MKQLDLFENEIQATVQATRNANEIDGYGSLVAKSFGEFKAIRGIARKPLWGKYFTTGDLIEIAGQHGVGKTYWLYKLIFALATGTEFFKEAVPSPKKLLLLDGELPIDDINQRFSQITSLAPNAQQQLLDNNFSIINREFSGGLMANICTINEDDELFQLMAKHDVVVIDSLKTNSFGSNISNADDVAGLITMFLKLKALGTTVIYVNHLTKNQTVLGSVDFDIINDVTIALSFDKNKAIRKFSVLKGRSLSENDKAPKSYSFKPDERGIPFTVY
ncbi:AAA family ATPase [Thalassotalea ponticola]|uniref:AAA family ATPase n=1 Tax=Thalassotalea ponticola TaxID=1523392 RepID=UPI0025B470E5|nr:AAA family ATPase [Thalassotalea ponticola]MDN3651491.1 AAA family ATPase [Thalassotalea ponticola]